MARRPRNETAGERAGTAFRLPGGMDSDSVGVPRPTLRVPRARMSPVVASVVGAAMTRVPPARMSGLGIRDFRRVSTLAGPAAESRAEPSAWRLTAPPGPSNSGASGTRSATAGRSA